jgi:two-component system, sensor histidine kinase
MRSQLLRWFRNVSIKRKLYFVVGIMALLIAIELFTLWFAVKTLSSVRAYVGGEGLWSKAQKDAGYYLQKYGHTRDEKDYIRFQNFIKVPLGDAITRRELMKEKPNLTVARTGFIIGHNNPADIDGMIWLIRNFYNIYYIQRIVLVWSQAEPLMTKLIPISKKLHAEINSRSASKDRINKILAEIDPINRTITVLEDDFSSTLGEGSRWLENLILKILFLIAITVEFTGLFLTVSVSITISKGVSEVIRVSDQVSKEDLTGRAKVFSTNEIGSLANSFNKMVMDLQQKISEKGTVEESLISQQKILQDYALKLEQSNKDLEQFAYVASHDLKEPLRTISSYTQLIENKYKNKLDAEADEFIEFIVQGVHRMDNLINDLLIYSRLTTKEHPNEWIDCAHIVEIVLLSSAENIKINKAKIKVGSLPVIFANRVYMIQVFQNLINNAIKFRGKDPPEVNISAEEKATYWLFSVKDNGIGIEKKYEDRIFNIFQRLNSREKYEGTGIGLTICKKIIEQLGGKIWFESEVNKGATFYFTINKVQRIN